MAKKGNQIRDGFTQVEDALYTAMQEFCRLRLAGETVPDALQKQMTNAFKPGGAIRTKPKIIAVDNAGNPIDLIKYEEILVTHGNNIEDLVREVAFKEDPNGELWNTYTAINTSLFGKPASSKGPDTSEGGGTYLGLKTKTSPSRTIEYTLAQNEEPTEQRLTEIAKKLTTEAILAPTSLGFTYTVDGTFWGVDFIVPGAAPGSKNSKYFAQLRYKGTREDTSIFKSKNPNDFYAKEIIIAGFTPRVANKAVQIEHGAQAGAIAPAEVFIKRMEDFAKKSLDYTDTLLRGINDKTSERYRELNALKRQIESSVNAMKVDLKVLKTLGGLVDEGFPDATTLEIVEFYRDLVKQGKDLGFHVIYRDQNNKLSYREVKVSAEVEALLKSGKSLFLGRAFSNNMKGQIEKFILANLTKHLLEEGSSTILTAYVMGAMKGLFGGNKNERSKRVAKTAKRDKGKKQFVKFADSRKIPGATGKKPKRINPRRSSRKPETVYHQSFPSPQSQTVQQTDLLAKINRDIRGAVIDSMKRPALVNRTGRFAASVEITGLTDTQNVMILNYIYRRNPYSIFSVRDGRAPWNTPPNRDPERIIYEAIMQLTNSYGISGKAIVLKER
jgi:hypothetical protein